MKLVSPRVQVGVFLGSMILVGACTGSGGNDAAVDTGRVDVTSDSMTADVANDDSANADTNSDTQSDADDVAAMMDASDGAMIDADDASAIDASDVGDVFDAAVTDVADSAVPGDAGAGFACLGSVPVTPSTGTSVTVTVTLARFTNPTGRITDATVRACPRSDVTCSTPDVMGFTDASGSVQLQLPLGANGWNGYLEVTGPSNFPTRYFTVVPLTNSDTAVNLVVPSTNDVTLVGAALGASIDPARGHLVSNTFDCDGMAAAHVVNAITPAVTGNTSFYARNNIPVTSATDTDATGLWGSVNVPPGTVTVTATVAGHRIGETTVSVRAGYATTFGMRPMP